MILGSISHNSLSGQERWCAVLDGCMLHLELAACVSGAAFAHSLRFADFDLEEVDAVVEKVLVSWGLCQGCPCPPSQAGFGSPVLPGAARLHLAFCYKGLSCTAAGFCIRDEDWVIISDSASFSYSRDGYLVHCHPLLG